VRALGGAYLGMCDVPARVYMYMCVCVCVLVVCMCEVDVEALTLYDKFLMNAIVLLIMSLGISHSIQDIQNDDGECECYLGDAVTICDVCIATPIGHDGSPEIAVGNTFKRYCMYVCVCVCVCMCVYVYLYV